jgi:hypothetical protein
LSHSKTAALHWPQKLRWQDDGSRQGIPNRFEPRRRKKQSWQIKTQSNPPKAERTRKADSLSSEAVNRNRVGSSKVVVVVVPPLLKPLRRSRRPVSGPPLLPRVSM